MINKRLSSKSVAVLSLIAEGHSYSQIVESNPDISYLDIFAAAEEALAMQESAEDRQKRIEEIRKEYPRAYEKWTDEEEAELTALYKAGTKVSHMANQHQRQPGPIPALSAPASSASNCCRTLEPQRAACPIRWPLASCNRAWKWGLEMGPGNGAWKWGLEMGPGNGAGKWGGELGRKKSDSSRTQDQEVSSES